MRRLLSLVLVAGALVFIGPAGVAWAATTPPSLVIGSDFPDPDIDNRAIHQGVAPAHDHREL